MRPDGTDTEATASVYAAGFHESLEYHRLTRFDARTLDCCRGHNCSSRQKITHRVAFDALGRMSMDELAAMAARFNNDSGAGGSTSGGCSGTRLELMLSVLDCMFH